MIEPFFMPASSKDITGSSAEGGERIGPANHEARPLVPASWLKIAVIALMLMMIGALLRFPLRRIGSESEINYNEGWNAYKQTLARDGLPLYGAPPDALTGPTTYPPVSFHLVAWLAWLDHGDVVRTGRWVSLLALLATGTFLGLIVRALGADGEVAAFATLLYILGIAIFLPDRLGMNDPQLLGEAFTAAGLYFYVKWYAKGRDRVRLLVASALLFCLAGFTKQNLLAFPAAVGVDLLLRSRKRFGVWLGAMVIFAALFTGLTLAMDGRYFFAGLLFRRTYSIDDALASATQYYLVTFQGIVLVAIVWLLCRWRSSPLLASAFVFANALAFTLAGGDGVDLNIYFNAFAAGALICGVAVAEFGGEGTRPVSEMKSVALMAALLVCVSVGFPDRLQADRADDALMSRKEADFRAAVAVLKAMPGPALCENLLLCYRANKPYVLDTFVAGDQLDLGNLGDDVIPAMLRGRKFGAVELDALPEEASASAPLVRKRPRFSEASTDALLENYSLQLRDAHMLVFVAK
jgi:hypothetical protein